MHDFNEVSDKELRDELTRREALEAERQRNTENNKRRIVEQNVGVFLALVPSHSRTSCSDADPVNASRARCTRCLLLHVEAHGFLPDDIRVETELLFNYVTEV